MFRIFFWLLSHWPKPASNVFALKSCWCEVGQNSQRLTLVVGQQQWLNKLEPHSCGGCVVQARLEAVLTSAAGFSRQSFCSSEKARTQWTIVCVRNDDHDQTPLLHEICPWRIVTHGAHCAKCHLRQAKKVMASQNLFLYLCHRTDDWSRAELR